MAIKQFTFSFKLNAKELFAYVVEHKCNVNLQILSDQTHKFT